MAIADQRSSVNIATTDAVAVTRADIPGLNALLPPTWQANVEAIVDRYLDEEFFFAVVIRRRVSRATARGELLGVGHAIIFDGAQTAWLGHICVHPAARRRGLGREITLALVDHCRSRGCDTIRLTATPVGEQLYRTLGFRAEGTDRFYRGRLTEQRRGLPPLGQIEQIERGDTPAILALDRAVTGEARTTILEPFLSPGWKCVRDGRVRGFSLPQFGTGLVIADDPVCGAALLIKKHQDENAVSVFPAANRAAQELFAENGIEPFNTSTRMYLLDPVDWRPDQVYARGTAYTG